MDKHGDVRDRTSLNLSRLENTDSHTLHMELRVIGPEAEHWEHCKDRDGRLGHAVRQVQKSFAFIQSSERGLFNWLLYMQVR